jgi:CBS domain-containing protein
MQKTVREVMTTAVHSVPPTMTVAELDRAFFDKRVGGFPVCEGGRLIGLVTRSDVVRQLSVERSMAEVVSFGGSPELLPDEASASVAEIAERVGKRVADWTVKDLMVRDVVTVAPEQSVRDVARAFVSKRIHRAPVVEDGRLVGIVTSLDLVKLLA